MHANHAMLFLILVFSGAPCSNDREAPLDYYLGTWTSEFQIVFPAATEPREPFRGEVVARRIVGDRFVDQTGTYQLGGNEPLIIKTIMGHDPTTNTFPFAYFDSAGNRRQSTGRWNAKTQTMTSQFDPDAEGNVTLIEACFSTPGIEVWSIETRDEDGNMKMRIEGRNRSKTSEGLPSDSP